MLFPEVVRAASGRRNPTTAVWCRPTRHPGSSGHWPGACDVCPGASVLKVAGTVCGGFLTPGLGSGSCSFAGAHRGPSRRGGAILPDIRSLELKPDCPKHAIETILAELEQDELERLAIDIIREQRCRLAKAQELYELLGTPEQGSGEDFLVDQRRYEYHLALVMMKAHHPIAATVINKLGYTPPLPEDMIRQ